MIKLIATDMDGTLLNSDGEINTEIYDIIRKLNNDGVMFAAASGRQLMSLRRKFEPVADDIIYIAENGGYSVCGDEEIYVNALDRSLVDEILTETEKIEDTSLFMCGKKYSYTNVPELAEIMRNPVFGYEIKCVDDLRNVDDDIFKIGLFDNVDPRERTLKILKPKFEGRVHMTLSGYNSLDFLNIETNKGVALKSVMERFGVKREETVAFGDNYNDIEMFEAAGESYAMRNADEYVRGRAKNVIGTNDEDSVVKTIKSIMEREGL